jgi:hypothetical protein
MDFRRRFFFGLGVRLTLLLVAVFLFVGSLQRTDLGAARIVAALGVIGALLWLWRHIQLTNVELARFIDAVRFGDFAQGFAHAGQGSGFSELGVALDEAIKRLRGERHELTEANASTKPCWTMPRPPC